MNIDELFQELEQQTVHSENVGTLERRISTRSVCDLFVGVQKPANLRSLRVQFQSAAIPVLLELPRFHGLEVQQQSVSHHVIVTLQPASPAFSSVFTSLAEDITRHIGQLHDEGEAATSFFVRLLQWQRLLERGRAAGLTDEEQRGLYGELWFLREKVLPALSPTQSFASWAGPERAAKDFQFPGSAVEVKTTTARQHQHIQIASEKQLDDTGLNALFLCHLSLEASYGNGETLPQIVASVREASAVDGTAAQLFEARLFEAGYLDIHGGLYNSVGYLLRAASIYRVQDGFPKIVERDLRLGVGDVRYSISAAECQHYSASAEELRSAMQGASG